MMILLGPGRSMLSRVSLAYHKPVREVLNNTFKIDLTRRTKNIEIQSVRNHSDHSDEPGHIPVKFILKDDSVQETLAREGEIALRLAQRHGIPMEGACEASLACTTCHCYVEEEEFWDQLPEATETEEDLLDQAPFLEMNSRLGCQIIINSDLAGITLRLPRATKNFYVDGHVPQPH